MSEDLSRGDGEDDLRLFPVTSSRIDETWKNVKRTFKSFIHWRILVERKKPRMLKKKNGTSFRTFIRLKCYIVVLLLKPATMKKQKNLNIILKLFSEEF